MASYWQNWIHWLERVHNHIIKKQNESILISNHIEANPQNRKDDKFFNYCNFTGKDAVHGARGQ